MPFKDFNTWWENAPLEDEDDEDELDENGVKNVKVEKTGRSAIVDKIKRSKEKQFEVKKLGKKGKKILEGRPSPEDIGLAFFQRMDTNNLGELNKDEFMFMPEIAMVEMSTETLNEIWNIMDEDGSDVSDGGSSESAE